MKKKIITAVQLILAIVILTLIFINIDKDELLTTLDAAKENWPILAAALMCTFVCLGLCTYRWLILLRAIGLKCSFGKAFTLYFIGHFFNAMFPGVVGGDLPKAYYITKETHHKKAEVASTVFIDRIIGLIALLTLTTILMTCRLDFFLSNKHTKIALYFNIALLMGTIFGCLLVFQKDVFERFAFIRKLEEKSPVGKIINRIYTSFRLCLYKPELLIKTLTISLTNHILMVFISFLIGTALNVSMRFVDYLTVFPTINTIAAIPITPAGWGVREKVSTYMLGAFGVSEAAAVSISILVGASLLFWSIIGGVVYVVYSSKAGKIDVNAEMQDEE